VKDLKKEIENLTEKFKPFTGFRKQTTEQGDWFEGEWKEGVGQITEDGFGNKAKGTWKNGFAKVIFDNGHKYQGRWRGKMMHGFGTCVFPSGEKYEGQWKDGK